MGNNISAADPSSRPLPSSTTLKKRDSLKDSITVTRDSTSSIAVKDLPSKTLKKKESLKDSIKGSQDPAMMPMSASDIEDIIATKTTGTRTSSCSSVSTQSSSPTTAGKTKGLSSKSKDRLYEELASNEEFIQKIKGTRHWPVKLPKN